MVSISIARYWGATAPIRTKIGLPETFGGDFASEGTSGVEGVSNGYGSAAT